MAALSTGKLGTKNNTKINNAEKKRTTKTSIRDSEPILCRLEKKGLNLRYAD